MVNFTREDHLRYLSLALDLARKSPPKPTNFRVGAVIVASPSSSPPSVLSNGFTLELPGNTHAEQCALAKLGPSSEELKSVLKPEQNCILYTTLEPCGKRLSDNAPCVQRIIETRNGNVNGGIRKVIFGAKEPGTFVQDSKSCQMMDKAGVEWEYVNDLEGEILRVAKEGHVEKASTEPVGSEKRAQGTNVDNITAEERKRQEASPRNPKKRMMEVNLNSS